MNQAGIPVYFIDHSEFITGQCGKILNRANKNEIKCFDFGSIKRIFKDLTQEQLSIMPFTSPSISRVLLSRGSMELFTTT